MKTIRWACISALFLVVMLCVCANAEPRTCPYDIHLSITYNLLSEPERALFDDMYDMIHAGYFSVSVPSGVSYDRAKWMIDFLYNEAPELCALDLWNSSVIGSGDDMEIALKYQMPIEVQDAFIQEVEREARNFANMSEGQGIRAIYEALIRRFDYGTVDGEDTQQAYFALKNNRAICNGYAQTAAMLAHFAGYSCSYVTGYVEDNGRFDAAHAWNVALDNGRFIWFDATWDDGGSSSKSKWYGLDGGTMAASHRPIPEYGNISALRSILPDGVSVTMHLDANNAGGYVRGITDQSGTTVSNGDLGSGEFYSPAMVLWNAGNTAFDATVSCRFEGALKEWNPSTIQPDSNAAYRVNERSTWTEDGWHAVAWYVNGMRIGAFTWRVTW
ncbi:MAG: transglutaminase domain-containing protein [Clostridia bacterium]|nr:transglutaminase domain-containing protein [Clostridia bacterium]